MPYSVQCSRQTAWTTAMGRTLLLVLLFPAIVLGHAIDGQTVLIHSHGDSAGHFHLMPVSSSHEEHGQLDAWHADLHAQEHGEGQHHEEPEGSDGFHIDFPEILVAAPSRTTATTNVYLLDLSVWTRAQCTLVASEARPKVLHLGWSPPRPAATGIVALLRSSHAILI